MTVALYGGSFNPPHAAHVRAARIACEALRPDVLLVMPAADPPHKELERGSPSPEERLALTRLAFADFPQAQVSELEILRAGESYTADTVRQLTQLYPGGEIVLVMGADMLLYFEQWHEFRFLLANTVVAALSREEGDNADMEAYAAHLRESYGARVLLLPAAPQPMSSSEIRAALRQRAGAELLPEGVYERVIRARDYGAKPQLSWLREQAYALLKPKRVPHVQGTEAEAVRLARRWGEDENDAAEAAILHDITKRLTREEQLILCDKYGIMVDNAERESEKLLHARTGAALSRERFGVPENIYQAIRWHTTGKPEMTLLEKIIYLADYIEPTRDFPGVERLRTLAYQNIDTAMALGLQMCLDDLRSGGITPHETTVSALAYYRKDI
jgi:nicotinate-nucleotide adenylyltransferase